MKKYVTLEKRVGETPLECAEKWRAKHPQFAGVPLAYAGRLDPMASGKLLILIGDECKRQTDYHKLDKEYEFKVLFNMYSDTGDVLGLVEENLDAKEIKPSKVENTLKSFIGDITLPYPIFSSKTVQGKPLHTWTVEGRLNEVIIPSYEAQVYKISVVKSEIKTRVDIFKEVTEKIETIPPVTDPRKSLGNDFRRPDVRLSWKKFAETGESTDDFLIATIECVGSSGLYMRTLADEIAKSVGTRGLAFAIHRKNIGNYKALPFGLGFWSKRF